MMAGLIFGIAIAALVSALLAPPMTASERAYYRGED